MDFNKLYESLEDKIKSVEIDRLERIMELLSEELR